MYSYCQVNQSAGSHIIRAIHRLLCASGKLLVINETNHRTFELDFSMACIVCEFAEGPSAWSYRTAAADRCIRIPFDCRPTAGVSARDVCTVILAAREMQPTTCQCLFLLTLHQRSDYCSLTRSYQTDAGRERAAGAEEGELPVLLILQSISRHGVRSRQSRRYRSDAKARR